MHTSAAAPMRRSPRFRDGPLGTKRMLNVIPLGAWDIESMTAKPQAAIIETSAIGSMQRKFGNGRISPVFQKSSA